MSLIDRAFSIHDDALMLRSRRSSILAANIANADTPHYKARDLDFSQLLASAGQKQNLRLDRTHQRHLPTAQQIQQAEVRYRNPLQPSLDGNTVDMHVEQARFAQNALEYQTSLTMINSKVRGLMFAIKGQ
jgi:flagellar basal-body rod protein FlgB